MHTGSLKDLKYMFSLFQDVIQNKTTAAEGHPSTKQHIIFQMWTMKTIDLIIHNTKPLFEDKILPIWRSGPPLNFTILFPGSLREWHQETKMWMEGVVEQFQVPLQVRCVVLVDDSGQVL
jgi:hypothetical protein